MTTTTEQVGFVPKIRPADELTAGLPCSVCHVAITYKDVVMAYREQSTIANEIKIQPIKVMHKYCISGVIDADEQMLDEYDKIKQRVAEKGTMFDD